MRRVINELTLIKQCAEFLERDQIAHVPRKTRGIYALLKKQKQRGGKRRFDVVYIGMSTTNVLGRLKAHDGSRKKAGLWSHFSDYSVREKTTDDETRYLEGLIRHIFRKDSRANSGAMKKGFMPLWDVRESDFAKWSAK